MSINVAEDVCLIKKDDHNKDRYNLVYLIVFFTGIGVLIPWNFFITVKPYFVYKLTDNRNYTEVNSELQNKFENYLALASMIPIALTNIMNLFLRRYITPMRRFSVGISIMFLVFLVTLILTKIDTQNQIILFFTVTMISVIILNICSGIIQGSSLGIISMMPGRYIKGFMEGQAISGLIASLANIISITAVGKPDGSAFMYFLVALVFLIITALGFCRLGKMRFSKSYVKISNRMDRDCERIDNVDFSGGNLPVSSLGTKQSFRDKYFPLVKIIFWNGLSAAMGFIVTLSIFPAISSQIETSYNDIYWKKFFSPVTCFLLFNLADYIGRFLCGIVKFPSENHPKLLFFITLLRWIFIPLFFMCNIPTRKYFPKIFINDAYPIILTLLLGITNGYTITLSLIYAPNKVEEKDKEAVGTLMSLFMCFGLAFGVGISFLCLYII